MDSVKGLVSLKKTPVRALACAVTASLIAIAGCDKQEAAGPSRPAPRKETASPAEPLKESVTPNTPNKPATTAPATAATKPAGSTVEMGAHGTTVTPSTAPTGAIAATPPKDAPPIRPATPPAADQANVASFAGLSAPKPTTWQFRQPDPSKTMRVAEYSVPGVEGANQADIVVFQFPGGGTFESNLDRWKMQVQGADGKPAEAKIETFESDGLKISVAELAGAYRGMGSPSAVPDSILIAAMIEAEGNPVFVQLSGPAKTVSANREAFMKMLRGVKNAEPMK